MRAERLNTRYRRILDLLGEREEVSVQELARRLQVSVMTIRRDLDFLEREGRLIRTHGGAILSHAGTVQFSFEQRTRKHAEEKRAIAREIAKMIQPGMALALDSGTTTLEVARAIATKDNLTVLTASLAIASVLYTHENIELVLLGGRASRQGPELTGWLTEENLKQFHVDWAVTGADGIIPQGVFTSTTETNRVCKAVLACGERTILAADYSKFGSSSFVRFAAVGDFDYVVTDDKVPGAVRIWLEAEAQRVIYGTSTTGIGSEEVLKRDMQGLGKG